METYNIDRYEPWGWGWKGCVNVRIKPEQPVLCEDKETRTDYFWNILRKVEKMFKGCSNFNFKYIFNGHGIGEYDGKVVKFSVMLEPTDESTRQSIRAEILKGMKAAGFKLDTKLA